MPDCPQSEKCVNWVYVYGQGEFCFKSWTLECEEVQESRCPDFEKAEEERE